MSNIITAKTKLTIARVAIKRLTTADGLCSLAPHFSIGQTVLVDSATISQKEIEVVRGNEIVKREYSTICIVDEFGNTRKNDKGENISWIFFDCIEIDKKDAKTAGITAFKK